MTSGDHEMKSLGEVHCFECGTPLDDPDEDYCAEHQPVFCGDCGVRLSKTWRNMGVCKPCGAEGAPW